MIYKSTIDRITIKEMAAICGISEPKMHYIKQMDDFKMPKPINRPVLGKVWYWDSKEILPWLRYNGYFHMRIDGKARRNNYDWYFKEVLSKFVDRTLIPVAPNALYWKLNNYSKTVKLKEFDADHKPLFDDNYGRVMP